MTMITHAHKQDSPARQVTATETPRTHHFARLAELTMHYVTAGHGSKILVLLHGYPESWFCWREVIDELAEEYRIVAPDLRGLGDTTRPIGGYDKKTIAADIHELLSKHLGLPRFAVAGHDWGGAVACALAADHPEAVTHLSVVDVAIPGDGQPNIGQAGRRWHHTFLLTPDLPEALIGDGREHLYFDWFFTNYGHSPNAISPEARQEYLRTHTTPGALRAGFALPLDRRRHRRQRGPYREIDHADPGCRRRHQLGPRP